MPHAPGPRRAHAANRLEFAADQTSAAYHVAQCVRDEGGPRGPPPTVELGSSSWHHQLAQGEHLC